MSSSPASRLTGALASPRRRVVAAVTALVVVGGVVIGVTDPFAGGAASPAGASDNQYPTSTATVTEGSLSEQTSVTATLGYAGSYAVTIPSGTAASALTSAQNNLADAERSVAADERALSNDEKLAKPTNDSTLLAATSTVTTDEAAVTAAKAQLTRDEQLGCPASSSATVTTATGASSGSPSSGSSSPNSGTANDNGKSNNPSSGSTSPSGTTGNTGSGGTKAHLTGSTGVEAGAPSASTGTVDATTSTSTTVTGTVNPDGADTTYEVEYGTSANYGETTTAVDAGSGTSDVGVSVTLSGLTPGATYHYRLVAKNSLGTSYGNDGTVTTNDAPVATTGSPASLSATSESLAGTVTPNGVDTSYYFEWGTTSGLGNRTPVADAGAGSSASSVTATLTGLKAGETYDFALVATNSLGTSTGATTSFQAAASSCVAEKAVITSDETSLSEARDTLSEDELNANGTVATAEQQLTTDEATAAAAAASLTAAEQSAANPNTTFTALPAAGQVVSRGQTLYRLDNEAVPLLYGTITPYRALYLGVTDGPDIGELQSNLIALGFGGGVTASGHFDAATEAAVKAWQHSLGRPATGIVALGDFVVEPGAIEVDTVTATDGETASAGADVLSATSTGRVVTIALDAAEQSSVKVGDPVTITLPNNTTTPGIVSYVGKIATTPSSSVGGGGNTGNSSPTITVDVTPSDPAATGTYDEAPVTVAITSATVNNALIVPVDALLALSSGGYALEEVGSHNAHSLVAVSLGLFDDADGEVQVTGSGLAAGQTIVIPGT